MKPHEETWRGVGGYVEDVESGRLRAKVGDNNPERVALIAAAPKMARALLMCGCWSQNGALKQWHTHLCWRHQSFVPFNTPDNCTEDCRAAHAVLAEAGVLP